MLCLLPSNGVFLFQSAVTVPESPRIPAGSLLPPGLPGPQVLLVLPDRQNHPVLPDPEVLQVLLLLLPEPLHRALQVLPALPVSPDPQALPALPVLRALQAAPVLHPLLPGLLRQASAVLRVIPR